MYRNRLNQVLESGKNNQSANWVKKIRVITTQKITHKKN